MVSHHCLSSYLLFQRLVSTQSVGHLIRLEGGGGRDTEIQLRRMETNSFDRQSVFSVKLYPFTLSNLVSFVRIDKLRSGEARLLPTTNNDDDDNKNNCPKLKSSRNQTQ